IFNPRELAWQRQMLCEMCEILFEGLGIDVRHVLRPEYVGNTLILFGEMCEIVFEGLGIDVRHVLGPEYVGNTLILFVQFWHSATSRQVGERVVCVDNTSDSRARQIALVNGRQVWGGMRPSNTSRQTLGHYRGLRISTFHRI